jgi:hypothetical protein
MRRGHAPLDLDLASPREAQQQQQRDISGWRSSDGWRWGRGSRGGGNGGEEEGVEEEVSVGFVTGDRLAATGYLGREAGGSPGS